MASRRSPSKFHSTVLIPDRLISETCPCPASCTGGRYISWWYTNTIISTCGWPIPLRENSKLTTIPSNHTGSATVIRASRWSCNPLRTFTSGRAPASSGPVFVFCGITSGRTKGFCGNCCWGLLLASLFQLIFPFLTQALVDIGIQNQNLGFIYLILVAQLALFLGQTTVTIIQNWILLHIGTRINVSLVSDFLTKLMKLPIAYFDTKMIGDLLQRISDQRRIEVFLTNSTLNFIFSAFNLVVFGAVLAIYDWQIFTIFLLGSALYTAWIFYFLRRRKEIDYVQFQELSDNHSTLIEFIQGMQEIKLQNSGVKRRRQWSYIQAKLFSAKIESLKIEQWQDGGGAFISQLKDILITFLTAKLVLEGEITLGMMLAVQFIIGQMNVPLQRMINFVRTAQDAKISFDRLLEIQELDSEEEEEGASLIELPEEKSFHLENVSFRYNKLSDKVLKNVNLTIPAGKVDGHRRHQR